MSRVEELLLVRRLHAGLLLGVLFFAALKKNYFVER